MQAMNGLALFGPRSRVIGFSVGIALALASLALVLASKANAAEPPQKNYLALGDSVAFGYSQELFNENWQGEDPHKFEEAAPAGSHVPNGYTLDLFNKLKAKQVSTSQWAHFINNSCPGETTDGLIGNGPLRKQMEEKGLPITPPAPNTWIAQSVSTAPCRYHYAEKLHLHHEYGGNHSQLENALEVLKKENSGGNLTKHPVALITLNVGANDILRAVHVCEGEVKFEYEHFGDSKYNHPPYADPEHEGHSPKNAVVFCARAHTGEIFHHIFNNVIGIAEVIDHGGELGICVNSASPCDTGHKAINYTGAAKVLGTYDTFGSVFEETTNACQKVSAPAECNHELLEGSIVQAAVLNIDMQALVEEELHFATYTNPEPSWNPAIVEMPQFEWGEGPPNPGPTPGLWPHGGNAKGEPFDVSAEGTLQKWTNMANFSYQRKEITRSDGSAEVTEGSKIVKHIQGLNNGFHSTTEGGPLEKTADGLLPGNGGLKAVINEVNPTFAINKEREQPDEIVGAGIPAPANPFNPAESPATTPTGTKLVRIISNTEVEMSAPATATGKVQVGFKRADGPLDIHPTPVGYEVLANEVLAH
jgi:hypothetical protein